MTEATRQPESPGPVPSRPGKSDVALLEGPHSRLKELRILFRAMRDFVRGFRALHFVGPCVTIFGSARFGESHNGLSLRPAGAVENHGNRGPGDADLFRTSFQVN